MEIVVPQRFSYEIDGNVSISDIAKSLVALDRVTRDVGPFMEGAVEGLTIEKIDLTLREITQQSPIKELFWATILLTFQRDLEREVPVAIEKLTGIPVPGDYDTIVTVITMLLLFYGVDWLYQIVTQGGPSAKIRKMFDGLTDDAAKQLGVPKDRLLELLAQRYGATKTRSLAKWAADFFAPAKRHKGSRVFAGTREVSAEIINEIPSDVDLANLEQAESSEPYEGVLIELHAQDADRNKQGWAGVVPEITNDRLRMTLYPPIRPEDIYLKDSILGDIILVSRRQDDGAFKPYLFHLVRLRDT